MSANGLIRQEQHEDAVEITVGARPIREIHQEIQNAAMAGLCIRVSSPRSRHNLGVALPPGCTVHFNGSVGYYCAGLNTGARVVINGNAGWGCGEAMTKGVVTVAGYAGMSVGAAMLGGVIHVKGDCGPRAGVAMKGGTIIVEGNLGYQSGFMAHGGRIIALGGAGPSCADALWEGEVWVAGSVEDLGVDAVIREPEDAAIAEVEAALASVGLADTRRDWKRIVSAQRLWYFDSRDAKAWLMI